MYQARYSFSSPAIFRQYDYVFDQMRGHHTFMPQFLLNFHRVDTKQDMDAYISRLGESARALEQLLVRAEKRNGSNCLS